MTKTMNQIPNLFYSIRFRFISLFLIGALMVLGSVLFFNQSIQQQLIEEADNSLINDARLIANDIDDFNRRNLQAFQVASRLPIFTRYLENPDTVSRAERLNTLETLESLQIPPWNQFYALSYAILDSEGRNVLDTVETNIGDFEGDFDYFAQPFINSQPYISPIYFQSERGGIYFFFSVPIRISAEPATTIGVLRGRVAVSTLQDIIFQSALDGDDDIHVAIFDNNHVRLADTKHRNLLFRGITKMSLEQIEALKDEQLLPPLPAQGLIVPLPQLSDALSITRFRTIITGKSAPNSIEEERIAVARLETANWYLIVAHPVSHHYAAVRRQRNGTIALGVVLSIIAIIIPIIMARGIVNPIIRLTRTAAKVSSGDLSVRANISSRNEIGIFAETFDKMTRELEQMTENLEHRVEERTQELERANQELKHQIEERKKAEQQALELRLEEERRRIMVEFIQDVSHEFKTPISIINIKLHLLKRYNDPALTPQLNAIEYQTEAISTLVDNMILMSKLESAEGKLFRSLGINDLMNALVMRWNPKFSKKAIRVKTDYYPTEMTINANSEELWSAVEKVLDNALAYTPDGETVTITTRREEDTAVIEIEDTGTGIAKENITRVFERFFREDEAHTTRGFGLGLSIARRVIELHKGTIEIESTKNVGTKVTIRLPIMKEKRKYFD